MTCGMWLSSVRPDVAQGQWLPRWVSWFGLALIWFAATKPIRPVSELFVYTTIHSPPLTRHRPHFYVTGVCLQDQLCRPNCQARQSPRIPVLIITMINLPTFYTPSLISTPPITPAVTPVYSMSAS